MTKKFEGKVSLDGTKVLMPTSEVIPSKSAWHNYSIWEFNGKAWRPVSQMAIDNLEDIVKQLEGMGYKHATKEGKRKPSSLKYAIKTTGVEPFTYVK